LIVWLLAGLNITAVWVIADRPRDRKWTLWQAVIAAALCATWPVSAIAVLCRVEELKERTEAAAELRPPAGP
jgi:hypothetical protein